VRNPLSSERVYLRQTLLPSLFDVTRENLRFLDRVSIFEVGATYIPVPNQALPQETRTLGIVMTGPREAQSWLSGQDRSPVGFYDVKGVVEALVDRLNLAVTFSRGDHPAFHPGRCARVEVDGENLGVLGEIHPSVREAFELPDQAVCAVELNLDGVLAAWRGAGEMRPISTHPPVYEDLAFIVEEEIPAAHVRALIEQTGGALLRSVMLFDVYRGEQIGRDRKSLAYRLTYQAQDKTLTDREVAKIRQRIVKRLEKEVGATLRSS
jgi:phenylalanyl-tRNA synthetase beta chain